MNQNQELMVLYNKKMVRGGGGVNQELKVLLF